MIHVVLYEPEIPQNTGNIMRTCVGLGAKLHLIEPLGFKIDDTKLRRSAVDYYKDIEFITYPNWEDFESKNQGSYFFLTRYGKKSYHQYNYKDIDEDIYLIFGSESKGVDRTLLANHLEKCFRIPTNDKIRSLNLSNAVNISVFEVYRQLDFPGLIDHEPDTHKGKDYLENLNKGENI